RQSCAGPTPSESALCVEVSERLEARIDVVGRVIVDAVHEALAADRAQAGAVRTAERRDRLGELDRLPDGGLEIELVVGSQAERLVALAGLRPDRGAGVDVDRGQCLLLDPDLDRDLDVAKAAGAFGRDRRREVGGDDQAAVRAGETDAALDRVGQTEVVAEVDRRAGDLVVAGRAGLVRQETRDVPEEWRGEGPARGHRRTGSWASSSSNSGSAGQPASGSSVPFSSSARRSARRASSRSMPRLMLWRVLTTSPSSPTRTLTAYSSAPRRTSSASASESAMMRRLSASACWVSPRSSMRNAACSWARATIRSASSWAFSMIRSPSELMRFAARTSSGTATRSSSMRPSAAV